MMSFTVNHLALAKFKKPISGCESQHQSTIKVEKQKFSITTDDQIWYEES